MVKEEEEKDVRNWTKKHYGLLLFSPRTKEFFFLLIFHFVVVVILLYIYESVCVCIMRHIPIPTTMRYCVDDATAPTKVGHLNETIIDMRTN